MSDIGLNANIYQAAKKYLDVLNDFLLNHKLGNTNNSVTNESVAKFVELVGDQQNKDPHIQMLGVLIERNLRLRNKPLNSLTENVANSIRSNSVTQKILDQIETLTKILDSEYLKALGRTRGGKR